MARKKEMLRLTDEQAEEAEALFQSLKERGDEFLRDVARLLASKRESEVFGETEFQLRDRVHEFGADALQTALEEKRKKGGRPPEAS